MRWTGVPSGSSVADRLDWVAFARSQAVAGLGFYFVVLVDGKLAGSCDVRLPDREDPRIGEIGYLLVERFRGSGVMTGALRLLLAWGWGAPLWLERVQALTHPENRASARVLERLGFTREGVLRAFRAVDGGAREDRVIWGMLPIDFAAP